MTLGRAPSHEDAFLSTTTFCHGRLPPTSIHALLHRESHRLFPDDAFADLFTDIGRRSIPPRIVAVVMVLQRLEGLSDREAVDRFSFDLRWKYAAGGLDYDHPGFVHTVLVDMRARLRDSERPNRIFEAALDVARDAGLVGAKRVLDSTPLYDAVATQDTVTLIRSAIRGLLRVAGKPLEDELRVRLKRDDDYRSPGKPMCDWDDAAARDALIDALAQDAYSLLAAIHERALPSEVAEAAELLATVVGQDVMKGEGGVFRIIRGVAKDRVISTVDPEARHGHKTAARGFDGYKGHIAIDPDSEIITATEVTPGNVADGVVADALIADVFEPPAQLSPEAPRAEVYGDSSYGTADIIEKLEAAGVDANVKIQRPSAPDGHFTKDDFKIDLKNNTVTCPAGVLVQIGRTSDGGGIASFSSSCTSCPLRANCTSSKAGRKVQIHPKEEVLRNARKRQSSAWWEEIYRATRPKVERKLAHLMSRRHGGRCARVRGCERVGQDFALLCAAQNLRRLAMLSFGTAAAPLPC